MSKWSTSFVRFFAVAAVATGLVAGCADQSSVHGANSASDARARTDRMDHAPRAR